MDGKRICTRQRPQRERTLDCDVLSVLGMPCWNQARAFLTLCACRVRPQTSTVPSDAACIHSARRSNSFVRFPGLSRYRRACRQKGTMARLNIFPHMKKSFWFTEVHRNRHGPLVTYRYKAGSTKRLSGP